jgi:hypothetical protein
MADLIEAGLSGKPQRSGPRWSPPAERGLYELAEEADHPPAA